MEHLIQPFEVKFLDKGTEVGVFEGYGAYFNNRDSYDDVIVKGAFEEDLKVWKKTKKLPPMLSQHGGWKMSPEDLIPIGKWTHMEEDEKGLYVKGRLINLDIEKGKQIYGAMREGVLDGMSIGYNAKEIIRGTRVGEPSRKLTKIELVELSVVTFPANGKALVSDVKSELTLREFERALIRGTLPPLSAQEAKAFLANGYKAIQSERDAGVMSDELAESIRRNIQNLQR